ncbi:insulin-like growth factor-binding protein complex acid labile subunit [Chironomus tepperi]|uniref:insulin-like growth factor-binding protein complex acid labile subunit n=1 Tax=Chironomus tepperi TaxID=113505 RepID=UPI00391F7A6F
MRKLSIFLVISMMTSLANSAELTCNIDKTSGACYFVSITEVSQHNEAITVAGQASNYVNSATSMISFMDGFLIRYIPTKVFSIFPNIENFVLYNNSLTYMVTDSFANCASLKMIYIANTNVKNLPAGVAQTCTNINSFGMMDGSLETIDPDAFRGLSNLQMLNLGRNKIACLPGTLLQPTPNVMSISLENNMITGLDSMIIKGLKALDYFNLMNNQIQYLAPLDLTDSGIYHGLNIGLGNNIINAISPNFLAFFSSRPTNITDQIMLYGLACLTEQTVTSVMNTNYQSVGPNLQPCYNNWQPSMATPPSCSQSSTLAPTTVAPTSLAPTTVPPTPGTCPSDAVCRYFLDQYNRYTCILDGVDSLLTSIAGAHLITFDDLSVRRVVFTSSFLSRIPPILFQKFPNLEYLTASNCSMSAINTKTFGSTCGNLKFFDASYNDITSVDGASFKSCTKIEVVDLTGNQFSSIDGQLFVNNPTLKNIYINRPPSMVLL